MHDDDDDSMIIIIGHFRFEHIPLLLNGELNNKELDASSRSRRKLHW
jgi:hypothetical protein